MYNVYDIAGTTSRPRTFARSADAPAVDSLAVKDINTDGIFKTGRRVDPQRPAHTVHGRVITDDDPAMFTQPRTRDAGRPFNSLTTADIEGATTHFAMEVPVGGIAPERRRHFRVTNFVGDVAGSEANSAKRGLDHARGTNPNERDYTLLEGRRHTAEELAVGKSWYNAASSVLQAEAGQYVSAKAIGSTGMSIGVGPPAVAYSRKLMDPRDAELAVLKGQVDTLRRERDEVINLAASGRATSAASLSATAAFGATRYRGSEEDGPVVPLAGGLLLDPSPAFTAGRGEPARETTRLAAAAPVAAPPSQVPPTPAPQQLSATAAYTSAATVRASTLSANARNIIGVLPAFDSTALLSPTGAMRNSGSLDRTLDGDKAVPRGTSKFVGVPAPSTRIAPPATSTHAAAVRTAAAREIAREALEVKGLPSMGKAR
jgi:hypothetical protein